MATFPIGLVHQAQLAADFANAKSKLGPEILRVTYTIRPDSTDVPSIFFRVLMTDAASRDDVRSRVAERVETALLDEMRPLENWGLFPYFNYKNETEQRRATDPEWK